ncbi:AbrB/MazE/SpoVT family DNA-binding domain-containing protein [Candidatus Pacearchaeota archaeon]|nr:AbrB/MazE/SpoVT family DNA-binding domain-containing protein [Candidatus Pacearchaeota archaeon]
MEITKLSTKGQIVIPENLRKNFQEGTAFNVVQQNDLIILKPVKGLTNEELKEMKELERIWKDIDKGKGTTVDVEDFIKEMENW